MYFVLSIVIAFIVSILILWLMVDKPAWKDLLIVFFIVIITVIVSFKIIDLRDNLKKDAFDAGIPPTSEDCSVELNDHGMNYQECIKSVDRFEYDGVLYIIFKTKNGEIEIVPDFTEYD